MRGTREPAERRLPFQIARRLNLFCSIREGGAATEKYRADGPLPSGDSLCTEAILRCGLGRKFLVHDRARSQDHRAAAAMHLRPFISRRRRRPGPCMRRGRSSASGERFGTLLLAAKCDRVSGLRREAELSATAGLPRPCSASYREKCTPAPLFVNRVRSARSWRPSSYVPARAAAIQEASSRHSESCRASDDPPSSSFVASARSALRLPEPSAP